MNGTPNATPNPAPKSRLKKTLWIAIPLLLLAGYAVTFLPLDFLQPSIARSMAASLGRRVEIGGVHFTLSNGPGVALDQVTIHEDPRAGIEPFAYAETVQARLDLLALLGGHVRFSSLRFDDANLNLVKPDNAPWNFQMLLTGPANSAPVQTDGPVEVQSMPAVRMRAGRVNLKFGATKSVVYFDDVDLDLTPQGESAQARTLDLRFSGVPARTDRTSLNLEHFFIRGTYAIATSQLALKAELEPSPVDAVARLFVADSFPLKGALAMDAEIAGPPSHLVINGKVNLDGASHWAYTGELNLRDQQLQLQNVAGPAANTVHLHVWDLLKVPHWETTLEHVSLETFVDLARRLGAPVPEKFSANGTVDGGVALRDATGLDGQFEIRDGSLQFPTQFPAPLTAGPGAEKNGPTNVKEAVKEAVTEAANGDAKESDLATVPVQIPRAMFSIKHSLLSFGPVPVQVGGAGNIITAKPSNPQNANAGGTAEITGKYWFDGSRNFDIRFASKGLNLARLDTRMLAFAPVIQRTASALWRGSVRYQIGNATVAQKDVSQNQAQIQGQIQGWTGDYEILNARIALDGVADPLLVQSAKVTMLGDRVAVTRINARLAGVPINGEYSWSLNPKSDAPQTFRLQAGEITVQELDRLFRPTLSREGGFLSGALRLGQSGAAPDWLGRRKVEGVLSINAVTISPSPNALSHRLKIENARVSWDGKLARVALGPAARAVVASRTAISSRSAFSAFDDAPLTGELRVDLSGTAPAYRFDGKIDSLAYKGGKLNVAGTITARGAGLKALAAARASGKFEGQNLVFGPTTVFQKASGNFDWSFDWSIMNSAPHLALSSVEMKNASETFSGQGAMQADGKLGIDLVALGASPTTTAGSTSEAAPRIHISDTLSAMP